MSSPKHIGNYDDFIAKYGSINEQDEAAADPFAAPADAPPAPAAATQSVSKYKVIFIDEGKKKQKFPGGGHMKSYTCYEINSDELDKWVKKHIDNEKKQSNIIEIIAGDRSHITDEERAQLKDFRKHVAIGHIGEKSRNVEVEFDKDDTPMTSDIEITFLDTKK
jgi:hypothetical protein